LATGSKVTAYWYKGYGVLVQRSGWCPNYFYRTVAMPPGCVLEGCPNYAYRRPLGHWLRSVLIMLHGCLVRTPPSLLVRTSSGFVRTPSDSQPVGVWTPIGHQACLLGHPLTPSQLVYRGHQAKAVCLCCVFRCYYYNRCLQRFRVSLTIQ